MLASSSSFLVNATPAPPGAPGGGDAPGKAAAAPGFAALLDRLSALVEGDETGDPAAPSGAHAAVATAFAHGLAVAVGLQKPAIADPAASGGGKDLPDGLPDTPGADSEAEAVVAADPEESDPAALPIPPEDLIALAAAPAPLPEGAEVAPGDRPASPPPQGPAGQALAAQARAAAAPPKPETPAAETRPVPAVSVSVAAHVTPTPGGTAAARTEPAPPARARPAPVADLARGDGASAPLPPAAPALAESRPPALAAGPAPAAGVQSPGPSPADITGALDRLVAAREALMPAHAALSIDHAEFGEVSIRFEHKADGRLSAELAGADPELHRAVTAAVAAERGSAASPEGEPGRPAQLASQRNPAGGNDAASGERGQHGADRDGPQRRGPARPESHRPSSDPRPGIFA